MGYDPFLINENQFTTPSLLTELEFETTTSLRFKLAIETGKLNIQYPSQKFLQEIEESSSRMGDFASLSKVDKEILALALELKGCDYSPIIVSDDYPVQNVAEQLGLEYRSLSNFGIRYRFQWILYCHACRRKFSPTSQLKTCAICGTSLKRRVLRKIPSKHKLK